MYKKCYILNTSFLLRLYSQYIFKAIVHVEHYS